LETYGSVSFPSLLKGASKIVLEAINRGVIIVAVSQARKGALDQNNISSDIHDLGIITPGDITTESAIAKLSYLLGKYKNNTPIIKKEMLRPLRGEMTIEEKEFFSYSSNKFINQVLKIMDIDPKSDESRDVASFLTPIIINELIKTNNIEMLKKLRNEIKMGFKNFEDKANPLHVAAHYGNIEITIFLYDCKVNINAHDEKNRTPLNIACINNRAEVAYFLLTKGGEFNNNISGIENIFINLAYEGNLSAIKLFYECGADILRCDYNKRTLAHIAADEDNVEIIKYLIDEGLDINKEDKWGNTPMTFASDEIKNLMLSQDLSKTGFISKKKQKLIK